MSVLVSNKLHSITNSCDFLTFETSALRTFSGSGKETTDFRVLI